MTTAPHPTALTPVTTPSDEELHLLDAYWRTANYLAVGMIYLQDNPLLKQPLQPEHGSPSCATNASLSLQPTVPGPNFQRDGCFCFARAVDARRERRVASRAGSGHLSPVAAPPRPAPAAMRSASSSSMQRHRGRRRFAFLDNMPSSTPCVSLAVKE